jgi:hypothetical protein
MLRREFSVHPSSRSNCRVTMPWDAATLAASDGERWNTTGSSVVERRDPRSEDAIGVDGKPIPTSTYTNQPPIA